MADRKIKRTPKVSLQWFRDLIKLVKKDPDSKLTFDRGKPFVGGMFFYNYDAKYKDTLPYWDAWPLVIPFNVEDSRTFLGINVHYLRPAERTKLINALEKIGKKTIRRGILRRKRDVYDYSKLSYEVIGQAVQGQYYKEAVKRYLFSHIKSKPLAIPESEWEHAVLLPMASWQKGRPY